MDDNQLIWRTILSACITFVVCLALMVSCTIKESQERTKRADLCLSKEYSVSQCRYMESGGAPTNFPQ